MHKICPARCKFCDVSVRTRKSCVRGVPNGGSSCLAAAPAMAYGSGSAVSECSLCLIHGQTLANHSYVNISQVGGDSDAVYCHTYLETCCTATQGIHRGDCYFPDGTRLNIPSNTAGDIFTGGKYLRYIIVLYMMGFSLASQTIVGHSVFTFIESCTCVVCLYLFDL